VVSGALAPAPGSQVLTDQPHASSQEGSGHRIIRQPRPAQRSAAVKVPKDPGQVQVVRVWQVCLSPPVAEKMIKRHVFYTSLAAHPAFG
jgi:hypothetical protein